MKTHELYINDMLMDIDKDVNIYPKFQSPIFTDLKYITSHISNNISLPITANNARAIEMYHLADKQDFIFSKNSFPRCWHAVRYYRNGVEICRSAFGKLINIEDGRINFAFSWGNIENFQQLFDKELNTLSFATNVAWNKNISYVTNLDTNYGFYCIDFGAGFKKQYQHPCIKSNYVISQIASDNGITINNFKNDEWLTDNYLIPCLTKKSNEICNFYSRYWSTKNIISLKLSQPQISNVYLVPEPYNNTENPEDGKYNLSYFHDPASLWNETENKFDVTDIDKIRFQMSEFTLKSTFVDSNVPFPEFELELCSGISIIPIVEEEEDVQKTYYFGAINMEIDVAAVNEFMVKLGQIRTFIFESTDHEGNVYHRNVPQNVFLSSACPTITIVPELKELRYGTKRNSGVRFPLAVNLPDMTQSAFLHAMMQMNGLFAYAKDEKTIDFLSIDDILENIPKALDWTDKLVNTSLNYNVPENIEFEFLDFERQNRFTYSNDSEVTTDYGASMYIENETIKESKDKEVIKLPFSPSNSVRYLKGPFARKRVAKIPLYTIETSEDTTEVDDGYDDGLKPRILSYKMDIFANIIASFQGLDWKNIISKKYIAYQKIIKNPRVLKVRCRLSDIDLSKLDFSLPVKFAQFGNYYVIITIQTTANGICKCEFLEIKTDFDRGNGEIGIPG